LDADPRDLQRVLLHSIVRTCQRLNSGAMHFTVGIVLEVRNCPVYKVRARAAPRSALATRCEDNAGSPACE
jgi:hypothetical protein